MTKKTIHMFDNIDYENSIKELMMFYGLDVAQMEDFCDDLYYYVQSYVITNAIEIIEEAMEINSLYEFLKNCEGSVWQIEGTITNSQCDIRKGCISIAKVTHKNFQKDLILFVNDWLTKNAFACRMRKYQKPDTKDVYNRITKSFKTNALLGLGA